MILSPITLDSVKNDDYDKEDFNFDSQERRRMIKQMTGETPKVRSDKRKPREESEGGEERKEREERKKWKKQKK